MSRRQAGVLSIIIGLGVLVFVWYFNSTFSSTTRPFSDYTLLTSSWQRYKTQFINQDGRVIDMSQEYVTTSEGQSYAMLRSVFIDDRQAFDNVWRWTKENLKRPNDNLFGWRWGKRNDGVYGFLENGGDNSAADADSDIALALILADKRWRDEKYSEEAKNILADLWSISTDTAGGKRYLIAGNWAKNQYEIVINPSYFSPYAWRIFAGIDKNRDWKSLVDPAYGLLTKASEDPLGSDRSSGLPPDWVVVDKASGNVRPSQNSSLSTNYSFDAIRVPWRIALDYIWFRDQQAYDYLSKSFQYLDELYSRDGKLPTSFTHNGQVLINQESPVMYATAIGYFSVVKPEIAQKIYQEKILRMYSNDENMFMSNLPYYEQNWLWFGSALYNRQLNNFNLTQQ